MRCKRCGWWMVVNVLIDTNLCVNEDGSFDEKTVETDGAEAIGPVHCNECGESAEEQHADPAEVLG